MIRIITILALVGGMAAAPSFAAFTGVDIEKPMSKEEFMKRLKGSFGFLSQREPALNPAEYAIIDKFVPFLDEDPMFALEMIEGLTENNKNLSASFDFALGSLYAQQSLLEKAERSYKNAIEKYPDYLKAWRFLGMLYLDGNDIENSILSFTKAVQLGDSEPGVFGQLGYCFFQTGEYLPALSAFSQAVLVDPRNERWLQGKLATLIALEDYRQASVILQDLVKRLPDNRYYWMALANVWTQLGDPMKAARSLEYLRGLGDAGGPALEMLAASYLNLKLPQRAFEVYKEFILEPGPIRVSGALACAGMLRAEGLTAESAELLDRLSSPDIELKPSDRFAVWMALSQSAEEAGDLDGARDYLKEAAAGGVANPGELALSLARLDYAAGDRESAIASLAKAEAYVDQRVSALSFHAQILAEERQFAAAERLLEEAVASGAGRRVTEFYEQIKQLARKAELDRLALGAYHGDAL